MPSDTLTGDDLRLLRVSRRLTATAVARHYGASPSRVTNVESTTRPTRKAVQRYLAALSAAEADR